MSRKRYDGSGWRELEAKMATASRRSAAPDSREVRLSARAIKILSKNERHGQGGRKGGEDGEERARERRRKASAERNLKGHPNDTPLYAAADTPTFCASRSNESLEKPRLSVLVSAINAPHIDNCSPKIVVLFYTVYTIFKKRNPCKPT